MLIQFYRTADSIDFGLDQLDTKKKIRPKLGTDIQMRLRFVQSSSQRDASGPVPGGKSGYALVSTDGESGGNLGADQSIGSPSDVGVEMAPVTSASAETPSSPKGTPMPISDSGSSTKSSKSAKKTEAAFTSLVTGKKPAGLEQVVL